MGARCSLLLARTISGCGLYCGAVDVRLVSIKGIPPQGQSLSKCQELLSLLCPVPTPLCGAPTRTGSGALAEALVPSQPNEEEARRWVKPLVPGNPGRGLRKW
jgi:hypothetical protein